MTNPNTKLSAFRSDLTELMEATAVRPFLCNGSPIECETFIVGFNPATSLDGSFWRYWDDRKGYDKPTMMRDYLQKRNLSQPIGVRARIERIVDELPAHSCLETNICSTPTRKAADLHPRSRATNIFEFLLRRIKPKLVYAHSNEPIKFFQRFTDKDFCNGTPRLVNWEGQEFLLIATEGPLFRMGFDHAGALGRNLADVLETHKKSLV